MAINVKEFALIITHYCYSHLSLFKFVNNTLSK